MTVLINEPVQPVSTIPPIEPGPAVPPVEPEPTDPDSPRPGPNPQPPEPPHLPLTFGERRSHPLGTGRLGLAGLDTPLPDP
jgi:hypothetical protein